MQCLASTVGCRMGVILSSTPHADDEESVVNVDEYGFLPFGKLKIKMTAMTLLFLLSAE